MTRIQFIARVSKQGNRFAVFIPSRMVKSNKDILKLHKSMNVKVSITDEI